MTEKIELSNLKKAMDMFGQDLIKQLAIELLAAGKDASGTLIKSLDYEVIELIGNLYVNIEAADYLQYVDKGRRPNKKAPPTQAIVKWMDIRGIKGRDKKGRFIKKQTAAFLIARSIGKNGIKPANVVKKSIAKVLKAKRDLLKKAAGEDARVFANKVLTNAFKNL
jgi:hypothetical protein